MQYINHEGMSIDGFTNEETSLQIIYSPKKLTYDESDISNFWGIS